MSELHYQSLLEIGRRIQSREISSVEVTTAILHRIAALDPQLHGYIYVMKETALKDAAQADKEISNGEFRGPLHGVPIALKDLIWTKDAPTTHGMSIYSGHYPVEDSTVVTRFKAAGAVIIGKLVQTESAFADHHPEITPPSNPWGNALWTGVSSSGSGVATAAGLCYGAIGTDTGGSIRFPSNANGLTGIKPTWSRVTRHGAFELAASLDHIGPIARSVADAAAMLQVIAGRDEKDPTSSSEPVPDYLALMTRGISGMRIGVDADWALEPVDEDTRHALRSVIEQLTALGAEIVPITMPDTEQAAEDWSAMCAVETAVAHEETFPSQRDRYGPGLAGLLDLGHSVTALEYQKLWLRRAALRGNVSALFKQVDLILSPVTAFAGLTWDTMTRFGTDAELFRGVLRYTSAFDCTGHPTVTLPCGVTSAGAPIGCQLIAAHFDEASAIRGAWAYQQKTDWHRKHPAL
ncbi:MULTISPECIES: amidase [unclassified Brenneria]|uniref:amidase n=1 Tax=unclassified Brenneria TaxID=2634434 RepID=UPI0015523320|nr:MULTISPECIES: amidase [unclassified Brenneria]MBJ7221269.1 amidase [Brenneria sp. L3-3C-1]MEE3642513.1 amidase [Brenneria sp. L3_3C_1]MEE3650115.1 amidase [Brenneria sp. HEZEL_4_2_4]NPD00074.1 amidase [Brenneria sp. hezel4-2-4]